MDKDNGIFEQSLREFESLKAKIPQDLQKLDKVRIKAIGALLEKMEKDFEQRISKISRKENPEEHEQMIRLINTIFDFRLPFTDAIVDDTLPSLLKPPIANKSQNKMPPIINDKIDTNWSVKGRSSKNKPPATQLPLANPIIQIEEGENIELNPTSSKKSTINTFIEFRKETLSRLLPEQTEVSKNEPPFAFRVFTPKLNRGWTALPSLPENGELGKEWDPFRLVSIFLELSDNGLIEVVYLYNWFRKTVGAYRNLTRKHKNDDARLKQRLEALFDAFLEHIQTTEQDYIIHLDFFAQATDTVPFMVWNYSDETGSAKCLFRGKEILVKTLTAPSEEKEEFNF